MSFEKMEPIEGRTVGCLNCGYKPGELSMDDAILDGTVVKSGVVVYDGMKEWDGSGEKMKYLNEFEEMAKKEPNKDWRVHFLSALSDAHYQRQGENLWVLYETGQGYA